MATSNRQTVIALLASAVMLAVLAMLVWTGVIDLGMDPVPLVSVLGLAVMMDLLVAAYLFMRTP